MSNFFRIRFGVVSRADGHSAVKRAAYQSCSAMTDHAGERFDFSHKRNEHRGTMLMLPDGAPEWAQDPAELWQRAGAAERRADAQEARTIELSLPRELPPELRADAVRYVFEPLRAEGMAWQVDLQSKPSRDGGENIHAHAVGTLRRFDGDGFARTKERAWNDMFRVEQGKDMRRQFAERLTAFCREHSIDYEADHRSNRERDLPAPEPQLPKWNFRSEQRTGKPTAAIVALDEHRKRRRALERAREEAKQAQAEVISLARERRRRTPAITSADPARRRSDRADRRAAILRAWHRRGWVDADEAARIARVRLDRKHEWLWIATRDGSRLLDTGDTIYLQSKLTRDAAAETAAAAKRHGWKRATVTGHREYKDAVTIECLLLGIETDHKLSPAARRELERRRAEVARARRPTRNSAEEWAALQEQRRRAAAREEQAQRPQNRPDALVPSWARNTKIR